MLGIFRKSKSVNNPIKVDIHSHLLPGLDDGVSSFEESLEIILKFEEAGYQKLVTTPHIMSDFYKNTPDIINGKLQELKSFIESQTSMIVEAAAEYYLDESFMDLLSEGNDNILKIDGKYVLFETAFISEPLHLKEAIFKIQSIGLKPILAHPERYRYFLNDWKLVCDIYDRGTCFQLNINSIQGYYSKSVQKLAMKLIRNEMVNFVGSDCHNIAHFEVMLDTLKTKRYQEAVRLRLINNSLLK